MLSLFEDHFDYSTNSQLVHISLYIYWYSSLYDSRSNSFKVVSMPCIFPSVISLRVHPICRGNDRMVV